MSVMAGQARGVGFAAGAIAAISLVSACQNPDDSGSSEPTVDQAGSTLKSHIDRLVKEVAVKDLKMSDNGSSHSCGKGKSYRTYALEGKWGRIPSRDPIGIVVYMTGLMVDIDKSYKITKETPEIPESVEFKSGSTTLKIESHRKNRFTIRGQTACLEST